MQNRTKPDKTGQPPKMRGPVTKLSPIVTNSRSHQTLLTSLVTNNGPLTRKIRFVTAPYSVLTTLSPTGECVTKSPWALLGGER